jgi:hypothetical protein
LPRRRLAEAAKFGLDSVIGPDARTLSGAIKQAFASAEALREAA